MKLQLILNGESKVTGFKFVPETVQEQRVLDFFTTYCEENMLEWSNTRYDGVDHNGDRDFSISAVYMSAPVDILDEELICWNEDFDEDIAMAKLTHIENEIDLAVKWLKECREQDYNEVQFNSELGEFEFFDD